MRLQSFRQTFEGGGTTISRRLPGIPSSAARSRPTFLGPVGAKEHELVAPAGRLRQAAQHPEHVVADPGTGVAERRDVDDDAHNYTGPP